MTALELIRGVGDRSHVGWALVVLGRAHETAGDLDRAEAALREGLETAADLPWIAACGFGRLASVLMARGDLAGAESYAGKALREGVRLGEYEARLVLAEVALARSDPAGERLAAEALDLAESGGYRFGAAWKRLHERSTSLEQRK